MSGERLVERPQQHPEVETYVLPDGTCLLFDNRTEMGHVLNALGALVWDYCDGSSTVDEIASELTSLLPEAQDVEDQMARLLRELRDLDLLQSPARDPIQMAGQANVGAMGVA